MDKLSIVVPCYNEENVIETFYNKLMEITEKISDKYDYEVIFVDDGSKDETFPKMKNLRNLYYQPTTKNMTEKEELD